MDYDDLVKCCFTCSKACMITELPVQSLITAVIRDPAGSAPVIRRWRRVSLIPDPRVSDPWSTADSDLCEHLTGFHTTESEEETRNRSRYSMWCRFILPVFLFYRHAFTNPLSHSITDCQAPQRMKNRIISVVRMSCVSYSSHMMLWADWNIICQSSSLVICRSHSHVCLYL